MLKGAVSSKAPFGRSSYFLKEDPEYGKKNFEFAVLETFGSSTGDDEILQRESWWKDTLGSRSEMNRN